MCSRCRHDSAARSALRTVQATGGHWQGELKGCGHRPATPLPTDCLGLVDVAAGQVQSSLASFGLVDETESGVDDGWQRPRARWRCCWYRVCGVFPSQRTARGNAPCSQPVRQCARCRTDYQMRSLRRGGWSVGGERGKQNTRYDAGSPRWVWNRPRRPYRSSKLGMGERSSMSRLQGGRCVLSISRNPSLLTGCQVFSEVSRCMMFP